MQSSVVVHFSGGKVRKGVTSDFYPNKSSFHLSEKEGGGLSEVGLRDLKAVFFVKTFEGNPTYREKDDTERSGFGKRIRVRFKDGETQVGYTQGYTPGRPGFFVFPADPESNNERIYVVSAATSEVGFV